MARRQGDKQGLLCSILNSCKLREQTVIFVRANESVRQLQKLVGAMLDSERHGMNSCHALSNFACACPTLKMAQAYVVGVRRI